MRLTAHSPGLTSAPTPISSRRDGTCSWTAPATASSLGARHPSSIRLPYLSRVQPARRSPTPASPARQPPHPLPWPGPPAPGTGRGPWHALIWASGSGCSGADRTQQLAGAARALRLASAPGPEPPVWAAPEQLPRLPKCSRAVRRTVLAARGLGACLLLRPLPCTSQGSRTGQPPATAPPHTPAPKGPGLWKVSLGVGCGHHAAKCRSAGALPAWDGPWAGVYHPGMQHNTGRPEAGRGGQEQGHTAPRAWTRHLQGGAPQRDFRADLPARAPHCPPPKPQTPDSRTQPSWAQSDSSFPVHLAPGRQQPGVQSLPPHPLPADTRWPSPSACPPRPSFSCPPSPRQSCPSLFAETS